MQRIKQLCDQNNSEFLVRYDVKQKRWFLHYYQEGRTTGIKIHIEDLQTGLDGLYESIKEAEDETDRV